MTRACYWRMRKCRYLLVSSQKTPLLALEREMVRQWGLEIDKIRQDRVGLVEMLISARKEREVNL